MLIEDLTLIKCLGKGACGEVYLTSRQGSKQKYATKKIDKKYVSRPKAKKYLDNEIKILKEVDHPNIIKLYEVKETTQFFYLIMELCNGGSLADRLEEYIKKNKKPFPEETVQYLMKQIMSAINYLHSRNILHRDIKLDNILVNFDNDEDKRNNNVLKAKVKIIDFGFARHLAPAQLAYSTLGSPVNMDPGILRKLNKMDNQNEYGYDEKADIWSLGTICYEMLIGKSTFDANSMRDLVRKVESGNYYLPTTLSKEAVSFLNGMLQYDSKKRLSANQLYNHKFLKKPYSELTKINLKEASKNIIDSQLKINSKNNQSIWVIFETNEEDGDLDDISPMVEMPINHQQQQNVEMQKINNNNENKFNMPGLGKDDGEKIDEKVMKKNIMEAFDMMNDDFIFIEPKLIPVIPGDDPTVINKVTEFNEDNL